MLNRAGINFKVNTITYHRSSGRHHQYKVHMEVKRSRTKLRQEAKRLQNTLNNYDFSDDLLN